MEPSFALDDYDYVLPPERIAQRPAARREESRLLVLDCPADRLQDRRFLDVLAYVSPGDTLVVNNTKVFPARLRGRKETGGQAELLLLALPPAPPVAASGWQEAPVRGLLRSSKRPRPGSLLHFQEGLRARVEELLPGGQAHVTLLFQGDLTVLLERHGMLPLPPYIARENGELPDDRERYQTVYAARPGAIAAPTAGLHFTPELLRALAAGGVQVVELTLHVGYGTFAPVRAADIRRHEIHAEYVAVNEQAARVVNETKARGGKIWAVGTTTVRALEYAATRQGLEAREGWCDLFIYPGFRFRIVDNLITNFHLPRSSLLFLVSALAGRERILRAYGEAIARGYRFYSYGDAMAIIT